ncbi:MAG: T9SS type A sorting domain-containing protein, partial [Bacteroidota bacterium]
TSAGYWSSYPDSVIYLAVKARLYFNVHSGTFTGGEIRGNIGPGSFIATGVEQISDALPASFKLEQNYPNPFNPSTSINFSVKRTAHVSLKVFNLLGQVVAVLMDEIKAPGSYKVTFDARFLSTGIYFYRLAADNFSELRKMVLLK